jgi:hypothetical protein
MVKASSRTNSIKTMTMNSTQEIKVMPTTPEIEYYIRSSLLGNEVVTEVDSLGKKQKTFITGGGNLIATQSRWLNNSERVTFTHRA